MNTKPFLYQLKDARQIYRFGGRALLALEMGLGKTLVSLLYAHRHPELRPMVVVCPASLKWNWEREAAKHFSMSTEVLSGTKPPTHTNPILAKNILIINYDILGPWLGYLQALKPQIVVIDEAHYCGNRRSQRTRAVQQLCQGVPNVLALSGTPLTNRPAELWPILNILRPDLFSAFWPFAMKFCAPKRTYFGWDVRGASNLDTLHRKLSKHLMIRRRKEDVLDQLPAKRRNVIPLELDNRREYETARNDFIAWLARIDPSKAKRAVKAQKIVKLGYLKRLAGKLKLKAAIDWIDDFLIESDGKIVLFAVHKEVIATLKQKYDGICTVVDGGITGKKRQLHVDKFQKDPKCRIFIGNIKAAGVGLTLTAASTLAFIELDWVPGAHTQAEDRIHRIGQKNSAQVYYLVARDTIEEHLVKIIQQKQKIINITLDGVGSGDNLDVFDQLESVLKASAVQTPTFSGNGHSQRQGRNRATERPGVGGGAIS